VIVDEAGLMSTVQALALFRRIEESGARAVLVGDDRQMRSVTAGNAFAQLLQHGMPHATVSEVQRQKNADLKLAAEMAAEGKIRKSLDAISKSIEEVRKPEDRHARIADAYAVLSRDERSQTMVIAGTRVARDQLNLEIRARVIPMDATDTTLRCLVSLDLTEEQCRSAFAYEAGDMVVAQKNYESIGLRRGQSAQVLRRDSHGRVILRTEDGREGPWSPASGAQRVTSYRVEERTFAVGDVLMATANVHELGLVRGERVTVREIHDDDIVVEREPEFPDGSGSRLTVDITREQPLDYGYASTIYVAQGATCDRVLIDVDTRSLAANERAHYVAVTRARHEATIYTDRAELLPEVLSRDIERPNAMDLVPEIVASRVPGGAPEMERIPTTPLIER
jgi:ATP-dependent exoDNAse (exonuclease V) alpha subunit